MSGMPLTYTFSGKFKLKIMLGMDARLTLSVLSLIGKMKFYQLIIM